MTSNHNSKGQIMCQCVYCDEPIFEATDEARMVFGELMHADCEVQFFAEFDAATVDNEALV